MDGPKAALHIAQMFTVERIENPSEHHIAEKPTDSHSVRITVNAHPQNSQ
jgi:hypothetical protein